MFWTVPLSIISHLFTVHSAMVYVIQVRRQLLESCLQTCMTYTIAECKVNKLLMMDRGTVRNIRVSCQNKFVKLVHLVGFIIKKFVTMHGHINVEFCLSHYLCFVCLFVCFFFLVQTTLSKLDCVALADRMTAE